MIARRLAPALAVAMALLALPATARAEPGDELTISVLTFGPGDHPFFKFGHNAILIHDAALRRDWVYNFGTFGFDSPWLILDFLKGKLRYWLSVQSLRGTINGYKRENRTIDAQELNLTPAQRRQMADALAENELPANRYYKYDYYGDNCSTRVRDAVDRITGGRVKAASTGPATMTFRQHTLRLTADDIPISLGLNIAMGDYIDKPVTVWEEMFLPSRLQETLRTVKVAGPDGEVPLVKTEKRILEADRGPLRTAPPNWTAQMFLVGAALGGGLALLGKQGRKSRGARVGLGVALSALGFVLGLLGLIFLMFWTVTDHAVAYRNENLLQCAPWAILLVGYGVGVARGKSPATRRAFKLVAAAAAASVLGLVCKVLPWFDQQNVQIIALTLPLWLGALGALHLLTKGTAASIVPAPRPAAAAGPGPAAEG
jgi:hypothetical protein